MKNIFATLSCLVIVLAPLSAQETEGKVPQTLPAIAKDAKHPENVNLKLMSTDATYAYSDQNPVRVGEKGKTGSPAAERKYLASLLDSAGKAVSFKRLGSGGDDPQGDILDLYEIKTSTGKTVILWISMYHPENKPATQAAPVGFYKKKG